MIKLYLMDIQKNILFISKSMNNTKLIGPKIKFVRTKATFQFVLQTSLKSSDSVKKINWLDHWLVMQHD